MSITALPTAPSRADPANFATRADAFLPAINTFATEANALATTVNGYATAASASAADAAISAAACLPGGSSGQVQYKNGTSFTGSSGLTIVHATQKVSVSQDLTVSGLNLGVGGGDVKTNTSLGKYCLLSNSTGEDNTAVGRSALQSNIDGSANTATGRDSLFTNTTGGYNTASGYRALYFNLNGYLNTAVGQASLQSNTSGNSNVAMGSAALSNNNTGNYNVGVGETALSTNNSGSNNTAVGRGAGSNILTGSGNTLLGADSSASTTSVNNEFSLFSGSTLRLRITDTNIATFEGIVKSKVYTISAGANQIPAAATAGAGSRAFVSDALSPTFGAVVAGGGSVTMSVFSNGTAWIVG